ncbi:MAG: lipopolysaccharide biosynthesis protein [Clostridiaceae bacterium]|nr:lipopolysaccharide biosynthesis protein [Clostridiaceae bacterium]
MVNEHTKSRVLSSLFWKFMERGGTQGIQFIVQIILARLLLPADYGIIALVVVFTSIAAVFVQSGLNTALIQKKDADEVDFSSVFYLSLSLALIIYILLFLAAPSIAKFYAIPQITPVFRALSITLLFGAFNSIQNAVIARNLQFKKLFFSSTGAILVSGAVGIYMAYTGYGVWALAGQQISNQFLVTLILWFTVKWRPRLVFSIRRVKSLFSYGWKLLLSGLIDTVYRELRSLIIGKMYAPAMLGFYDRGKQFPSLIISNIDGSIQSVMFPVLSAEQDNRPRVKDMMRRAIVTSSFVVFPAMVGLAVIAEPLVKLLLTDKWLPAVPFLQIFCAVYALRPIHTANLSAIKALGYSDVFLRLEIIKKIIGLSILAVTVFYGVYAIALGQILSGIISSFVNAYPNKRLLNYSYLEQWKDIYPALILSLVMGAVVYSIKWMGLSVILTLTVQILVGIIIYFAMAWIFKLESFQYLISTMRNYIG